MSSTTKEWVRREHTIMRLCTHTRWCSNDRNGWTGYRNGGGSHRSGTSYSPKQGLSQRDPWTQTTYTSAYIRSLRCKRIGPSYTAPSPDGPALGSDLETGEGTTGKLTLESGVVTSCSEKTVKKLLFLASLASPCSLSLQVLNLCWSFKFIMLVTCPPIFISEWADITLNNVTFASKTSDTSRMRIITHPSKKPVESWQEVILLLTHPSEVIQPGKSYTCNYLIREKGLDN